MVEVRKIAVIGATGRQGRGVVDALLYTGGSIHYEVRPMTRSLSSKLAQAFSRDYPQLDLLQWRQQELESLRECFEGCYGVFIIPGFISASEMTLKDWSRAELDLGNRLLAAAKAAKVSHLVYPTFPSIFNASNGRINIRYFETAHEIRRQIHSSSMPSTILCPGPFYTDFDDIQYARWEGDTVVLSTPAAPSKRMGWADPGHDIGWFTRAVFDKGPEWMMGLEVPVCGQSISYSDLASKFTAVTGLKAEYRQCSLEEFEARSTNEQEKRKELSALGEWLAIAPDDKACYGTVEIGRLLSVEKELGRKALSWEKFLERTGWKGPPRREKKLSS